MDYNDTVKSVLRGRDSSQLLVLTTEQIFLLAIIKRLDDVHDHSHTVSHLSLQTLLTFHYTFYNSMHKST